MTASLRKIIFFSGWIATNVLHACGPFKSKTSTRAPAARNKLMMLSSLFIFVIIRTSLACMNVSKVWCKMRVPVLSLVLSLTLSFSLNFLRHPYLSCLLRNPSGYFGSRWVMLDVILCHMWLIYNVCVFNRDNIMKLLELMARGVGF